jgi:hypothetical protein
MDSLSEAKVTPKDLLANFFMWCKKLQKPPNPSSPSLCCDANTIDPRGYSAIVQEAASEADALKPLSIKPCDQRRGADPD